LAAKFLINSVRRFLLLGVACLALGGSAFLALWQSSIPLSLPTPVEAVEAHKARGIQVAVGRGHPDTAPLHPASPPRPRFGLRTPPPMPPLGWPFSSDPQDQENFPGCRVVEEEREKRPDGTWVARRILEVPVFKYPYIRVESQLDSRGQEIGREEMVADHVMVRLQPGWDRARLEAFLERFGASVRQEPIFDGPWLIETSKVSLACLSQLLADLEKAPAVVEMAEPDPIAHIAKLPDDVRYADLYGMVKIAAPMAWDTRTDASGVVVAVVDTGIRYTHEDLKDNMWKNPGETGLDSAGRDKEVNRVDDDNNGVVDDVYGYDAVGQDGDPNDDQGHGTHCAGTVAASGNNGVGVVGVVWRAKIMACKFLNSSGTGTTSDAIIALNYARAQGAQITSNSWGGGGYSRLLEATILEMNSRNIAFVAAAGNSASDNDRNPTYPASYEAPNVVAVAATDANDVLANFSSTGARSVDLGAPGVEVLSSTYDGNSTYGLKSGTSMATPHVAGALTLLRAHFPSRSLADLTAAVIGNTDALPSLAGKCVSGGRLNVAKAMVALGSGGGGGGPDPGLPLNNTLAAAWILSASRFTSTVEGSRITAGGQSFWWRWTAPATGRLQIHSRKSTGGADTLLVVHVPSGSGMRQLLANDNASSTVRWSQLDFGVTKGTQLIFEVRGMGVGQSLVLEGMQGVQAGPANDTLGSPTVASGSRWVFRGSNYNASAETGEPAHAGQAANNSVWFSWIAPANRAVTLSTQGSSPDTVIAVYTGNTVGELSPVASNDNATRTATYSQVRFNATAGTTYRIALDTKKNMPGPYVIQLR